MRQRQDQSESWTGISRPIAEARHTSRRIKVSDVPQLDGTMTYSYLLVQVFKFVFLILICCIIDQSMIELMTRNVHLSVIAG